MHIESIIIQGTKTIFNELIDCIIKNQYNNLYEIKRISSIGCNLVKKLKTVFI